MPAEQGQMARKRGWLRAVRRLLLARVAWYRGTCYRGPSGTARLAKTEELAEVHARLGMASRGHEMFPGLLEEPQPLERGPMGANACRRKRFCCGREGAKVMQYNCESLRAVGRLGELARMAVKEGVDIICFQGTQMDFEGEWSDQQFMYFPLPRTRGGQGRLLDRGLREVRARAGGVRASLDGGPDHRAEGEGGQGSDRVGCLCDVRLRVGA